MRLMPATKAGFLIDRFQPPLSPCISDGAATTSVPSRRNSRRTPPSVIATSSSPAAARQSVESALPGSAWSGRRRGNRQHPAGSAVAMFVDGKSPAMGGQKIPAPARISWRLRQFVTARALSDPPGRRPNPKHPGPLDLANAAAPLYKLRCDRGHRRPSATGDHSDAHASGTARRALQVNNLPIVLS